MKWRIIFFVIGIAFFVNAKTQTVAEGVKEFRFEKPVTAAQTLKKVLSANPGNLEALYWLARVGLVTDSSDSTADFPVIPNNLEEQPLAKVIRGILLLKKNDTTGAKAIFSDAIGTNRKKDPVIQLAVAEANIDAENGNLAYAFGLLNEVERRDRRNPALFLARGDAYRKLYNGSEAFRNYQSALELDQADPVAYYKIGKIYQTQNNADVYLGYYNNAINRDASFAPAYYQLYLHYYYKDVKLAMENLQKFITLADPGIKNTYLLADQYYVSKEYDKSILEAKKIIAVESGKARPRIYKLLANSYDALKDSRNAGEYLKIYLEKASDSLYTPDDFLLMAKIAETNKEDSLVTIWYEKALTLQADSKKKVEIVKKIIAYNKTSKNYPQQAFWFGQLNSLGAEMTNVDIFNWGIANYNAANYTMADSVFGLYAAKYPEQSFGYYWRARSNAAIDTSMETGIAVPYYEELINIASKDTANANNRKWLIQAYGYVAAYKVNTEKKYTDALNYYDKILELDPGNDDAEKYKDILGKLIDSKTASDKPKE